MLTKTISELQQSIRTESAADASQAAAILRSISKRDTEQILSKLEKEGTLSAYYDVYERYSKYNLESLRQSLEELNSFSAIDALIILHLIGTYKKNQK